MDNLKVKRTIERLSVDGAIPKEEQFKLFEEYHKDLANGIDKGESFARTVLILANEKLLVKFIQKIVKGISYVDDESDLYFKAKLALIEAVDTFDLTKNVSFSTYAFAVVNNAVLQYLNKRNKENLIVISLSEMARDDNGDYMDFDLPDDYDLNADVSRKFENELHCKKFIKVFPHLTPGEQKVILLYFGIFNHGKVSLLEYSKQTNYPRQSLYHQLNTAKEKLRVLLSKDNLSEDDEKKYRRFKKMKYELIPEVIDYYDNTFGTCSTI